MLYNRYTLNFFFTPGQTAIFRSPAGWFNIKMTSYQYRKSHCGDKTILRPFYLHNGISYAGKISSLYWIRPQISFYQWDHLFIRMIAIGWWNEHIATGWWNAQQLSIAFRIPCQYTAALNSTSITTLRPTSPRSSTFPTMMFSSVLLNSTHGWDNLWASADNSLKDKYLTRVGTSGGNLWRWNTGGSIRLQYDQPMVFVYPKLWYQFGNKHWPFDVLKKKSLKKFQWKMTVTNVFNGIYMSSSLIDWI